MSYEVRFLIDSFLIIRAFVYPVGSLVVFTSFLAKYLTKRRRH